MVVYLGDPRLKDGEHITHASGLHCPHELLDFWVTCAKGGGGAAIAGKLATYGRNKARL